MSLDTQFMALISMIFMGIVFGASFDTYNRFLNRKKRKKWLVFINDILFWCVQAFLIFYVLYQINFGEIRFYLLLALLCGFSAYQALLKRLYIRLLEITITAVLNSLRFIRKLLLKFIFHPIKWLIMLVFSLLLFLVQILKNLLNVIFAIAKYLLKIVSSLIWVIFKPFLWLLKIIWTSLPNGLTNRGEKFFIKLKGKCLSISNYINEVWKRLIRK